MQPRVAPPQVPLEKSRIEDDPGFAAWSAHLIDEQGNGVFLSWGFGLPLCRLGGPEGPARVAPGLSLLVVAQGAPSLWLHQRFHADDAAWEAPAGRWCFGKSQVEALRDVTSQVVIANLECALPGTRARLSGHIEMGGPPRRPAPGGDDDGLDAGEPDDEWSPLMGPGQGRAILSVGDAHRFHLQGRAYHQRWGHRGALPEDALVGFGHLPFADRDISVQLLVDAHGRGRACGVVTQLDGRCEVVGDLEVERTTEPDGLLLKRGSAMWLELSEQRVMHPRGVEADVLVRGRAPLALPVLGSLSWIDARALRDPEERRWATRFLHVVDERASLATRRETGPVRGRWRRALSFR